MYLRSTVIVTGALAAIAPFRPHPPLARPGAHHHALPPQGSAVLDTAALRRTLREEMTARRAPGAVVAVVREGQPPLVIAEGVRSVETRDPMRTDAVFRIGSVTKHVTGIAALMLAAEGRLALDVPVRSIDPQLPGRLGAPTMRQLLTHTAGLGSEGAADGPQDELALAQRVRSPGAEAWAYAPPGDVYSYSSPGYWLAGHLLSVASKAPYSEMIARSLLQPLGMTSSDFRPTVAMTRPLAVDHRATDSGLAVIRPMPNDATTWASGSLFSTGPDLARLATALLNEGMLDGKQVIPRGVATAMLAPATATPTPGCGYSYGLGVCRRGRVTTAAHYGFRGGSGAVFTLVPERKLGIIVLANGPGAILNGTEGWLLRALTGEEPSSETAPSPERPLPAAIAGAYVLGVDTSFVERRGERTVYRGGGQEYAARFHADSTLRVLNAEGQVVAEMRIVPGRVSRDLYLFDGLTSYRRATPSRATPPGRR